MSSDRKEEGGEEGSIVNPIDLLALILLIYILLIFAYKIYLFLWTIIYFFSRGLLAVTIGIFGYKYIISPYVLPLLWDVDGKLGGYLHHYVNGSFFFRIVYSLLVTGAKIPVLQEDYRSYLWENFLRLPRGMSTSIQNRRP